MTGSAPGPGGITLDRVDEPVSHGRGDAPAVYGSLLVTTLLAVQWRFDASVEFIAFSLLVSVGVFWLTHVWSELVDRRVRGPVDRRVVAALARVESPMLTTALPPALVLALARLELVTVDTAIGLALAVSIVQLFLWGLAAGHAVGRGWLVAIAIGLVDCTLGLAIVALKVVVIH